MDLSLTVASFVIAHIVYFGSLDLSAARSVSLFSVLALLPMSLYAAEIYSTKYSRTLVNELKRLLISWMFAFAAIGLIAFLTKTAADLSRIWIMSSMFLSLFLLSFTRILTSLGYLTLRDNKLQNIVILGDSSTIRTVVESISDIRGSNILLSRVFDITKQSTDSPASKKLPLLDRTAQNLSTYIEKQRRSGSAIEQVWIAVSEHQAQVCDLVSDALIDSSVDVCVVPDDYTNRVLNGEISRIGANAVVNVSDVTLSSNAEQFKRLCDLVFASTALVFLGIPMLLIAAMVRLDSKGPALFRQKRYGIDGREIEVLKFRSMFIHSDNAVRQAVKDDDRVTRVGRILRRTSLDELPQLLNVLGGSMSLIGPRPHAVSHNEHWRQEIKGYMHRHKVKPGITGWAQVNGWRGETDTTYKMQQRVKHDLEYIKMWSPWLDFKILFLTLFVGFFHKNAY